MRQKIHCYGFRVWPPAKTRSVSLKKDSPCSVSFLCPSYEANTHTHSAALLFDLHKFWNPSLPELFGKKQWDWTESWGISSPQTLLVLLGSAISSTTCVCHQVTTEQALEILPCSLLCHWTALALQKESSSENTSGKGIDSFLEEGRNPTREWTNKRKQARGKESKGKAERGWGSYCYLLSYN